MRKKTILALSWRDIKAPKKGGAEVLSHALLAHLASDNYEVMHLSPMFRGASHSEFIDGVHYVRKGNIFTVVFYSFVYYIRNCKSINYVIDECNTHRFFTPFYVNKEKRVLFIHQLTREIWFINCKFPFNYIGYALETPMLRIYRKNKVITVSDSTRNDLVDIGFSSNNIYILPNGINTEIRNFEIKKIAKESVPTFIYVGRYASYKGIDICLESFVKVKNRNDNVKLWLVGKIDNEYLQKNIFDIISGKRISVYITEEKEEYQNFFADGSVVRGDITNADIVIWGYVSEEKKYELMKRANVLLFPSVREGWGIIVTEAAILGTPSLVTDAPGSRDAVDKGNAGYICYKRDSDSFAEEMAYIVDDKKVYAEVTKKAYDYSVKHIWDSASQHKAIENLENNVFF